MILNCNSDKGRAGLLLGMTWFGTNGYTISLPLNDTQWYDFVAEKDGKFYTVQCKFTTTKNKEIPLYNCGGGRGKVYDRVLSHPVDYLFCSDGIDYWVIPVEEIRKAGNNNAIHLRKEPNKNNQGFETWKYLV